MKEWNKTNCYVLSLLLLPWLDKMIKCPSWGFVGTAVLHLGEITWCTSTGWGTTSWKQPCSKGPGILVDSKLDVNWHCVWMKKQANSGLGCTRIWVISRSRVRSVFGLPSTKKGISMLEWVWQKAREIFKGLEHLLWEDRLIESGLLRLDKRRLDVYGGTGQVDRPRFFSVEPSERAESKGHKLKYRISDLNIRKSIFTARVIDYQNKLSREAVKPLLLEMLQIQPVRDLGSMLWVTLLEQGISIHEFQRTLSVPAILRIISTNIKLFWF